ncbi:TrbC/VirB2 family protein [Marinicella sp. W31]|uniref:TrbC/VirB2 family protein n=1 Tax=Marinicella sp. W31 TaxID=3023713 RepID=UPI003757C375
MNQEIKKISIQIILMAVFMVFCTNASAQAENGIVSAFQWLLDLLTGDLARIAAVIATVILGYSALTGRFDMYKAGGIILGIFIIFGAATIVDSMTGA